MTGGEKVKKRKTTKTNANMKTSKKKKKVLEKLQEKKKGDNQRSSFRCYVLYFLYIKRESTKNDA